MASKTKLPKGFEDLQPFADDWALAGEGERFEKLVGSSIDELRAFYDATQPRAEAAIAYLEGFDIHDLPDDAACLMNLLVAFVETAHPIELKWNETDIDDPFPPSRMTFGGARPASSL